jgi:acetyl esterase/lipase
MHKRQHTNASFRRRLQLALLLGAGVSAAGAHPQTAGDEPAPGTVEMNIDYRPDLPVADDRDRLDVFMPQGAELAPVVVFFHGGGLLEGDKRHGAILARRLVAEGVGVVSANYRLSPAFSHPIHLQDAAAAFAWVVAHIGDFGGDPGRVFVSGHSAGAYLAAMLALDASLLEAHGLRADVIAGAIAISPFLYVEQTAKDRPKSVWGEDPAAWLAASVTPHIGAGKGPMLLIYADGDDDWRRAQNERFAEAMQTAGSRAITARQVSGRDHTTVFTGLNEADDSVGSLMLEFIRR